MRHKQQTSTWQEAAAAEEYRLAEGCFRLIKCRESVKALVKLRLAIGLLGILFLAIFFGREIFFSIGLKYPKDQTPVYLTQNLALTCKQGAYRLSQGKYVPVLSNGHGTYYLSPSLGLDVNFRERKGIGVGGIWIPSKESKTFHVWEFNLTAGDDRSSRKKARKLYVEQDQPEWKSLQDPAFYSSISFTSFMERPLIIFECNVDPALVKKGHALSNAKPLSEAAALRAELEDQYKQLIEERGRLDTPEKIRLYNEKAAAYQKGKERLKELESAHPASGSSRG